MEWWYATKVRWCGTPPYCQVLPIEINNKSPCICWMTRCAKTLATFFFQFMQIQKIERFGLTLTSMHWLSLNIKTAWERVNIRLAWWQPNILRYLLRICLHSKYWTVRWKLYNCCFSSQNKRCKLLHYDEESYNYIPYIA